MKKFEAWIVKHKWLSIGIGVVVIVGLFFLFRRSGSSQKPAGAILSATPSGGGGSGQGIDSGMDSTSIFDSFKDLFGKMQENNKAQLDAMKDSQNSLADSFKDLFSGMQEQNNRAFANMNDTIHALNAKVADAASRAQYTTPQVTTSGGGGGSSSVVSSVTQPGGWLSQPSEPAKDPYTVPVYSPGGSNIGSATIVEKPKTNAERLAEFAASIANNAGKNKK